MPKARDPIQGRVGDAFLHYHLLAMYQLTSYSVLYQLTSYSVRVIKMNTSSAFLYQQAQSHPFPMNHLIQSLYQRYTSGPDIVPILADGKTEA